MGDFWFTWNLGFKVPCNFSYFFTAYFGIFTQLFSGLLSFNSIWKHPFLFPSRKNLNRKPFPICHWISLFFWFKTFNLDVSKHSCCYTRVTIVSQVYLIESNYQWLTITDADKQQAEKSPDLLLNQGFFSLFWLNLIISDHL